MVKYKKKFQSIILKNSYRKLFNFEFIKFKRFQSDTAPI